MFNKKGAELPMNTIIISIIVIVVLVIVIVFFLGGASSITQKISGIFSGATAGVDLKLAQQFCNDYCDQGRDNAFCKKSFKVDEDEDASTPAKPYRCSIKSNPGPLTIGKTTYTFDEMTPIGENCPTIETC